MIDANGEENCAKQEHESRQEKIACGIVTRDNMPNANRGVAPLGYNADKSGDRQKARNITCGNQEEGSQGKIEDRSDLDLSDVERRPERYRCEEPPRRDESDSANDAVG